MWWKSSDQRSAFCELSRVIIPVPITDKTSKKSTSLLTLRPSVARKYLYSATYKEL